MSEADDSASKPAEAEGFPPGVEPSKVLHRAVVNFDFAPMHGDELQLSEGMILWVVEKRDDGWWRGYTRDGTFGLFPGNFATPT